MLKFFISQKNLHFIPFISLVIILIIDLTFIFTTHQKWNSSMQRYVPLKEHIDKINTELSIGHLWLEEAITGDKTIDVERQVFSRFQHLMDTTHEYIKDRRFDYTHQDEKEILIKLHYIYEPLLHDFLTMAQHRWANINSAKVGSNKDQAFDEKFNTLISQVDELNLLVTARLNAEFEYRNNYFNFVVSLFILVNVLAFSSLYFTMRKIFKVERTLEDEKEKAIVTLRSIGDAVITTDKDGVIQFINTIAEQMTGYSLSEAIGQPVDTIFNIINEETQESVPTPVKKVLKDGKIIGLANHTALIDKFGQDHSIEDSAAPIINSNGDIIGVVLVFHDVSERREYDKKIHWQANHDSLTGLVNRAAFQKHLKDLIKESKQDLSEHALLFIDLDQFKVVNDTVGHMAGDELLHQISALLGSNIRKNDLLSRFGGDEFGIIFNGLGIDDVKDRAEKILDILSQYHFYWDEKVFNITASIGIVVINEYTKDENAALSHADSACYIAKDKGRNGYFISEIDDNSVSQRYEEMSWIHRIEHALNENKFVLYAQTIESLHDDNDHFEILIRMKDDKDRIIMPGRFIPVAERYNLMHKIDLWVIKALFSELQNNEKLHGIVFSVNLSGQSLSNDNFIEELETLIKFNSAIDFSHIIFEITETSAINNLEQLRRFILQQKEKGFRFSLDDFGTGLSSFTYLKRLPVDLIKIDGSFIKDILDDPLDKAMVQSIHNLSQIANIKTVAEYVENNDILTLIKEIGIDYAQGYEINIPTPFQSHPQLK